ncbi:FAD-dependent oxidoreductase [Agrobacterium vitis]
MGAFKALLSPLKIGNLELINRVFSSGHAPGYAQDGKPGERYQAYYEEKAKGGLGLAIFGGSSNVSRDSGSVYGQIFVGSDDIIAPFRQFSERMHRYDTKLMCQITHMGRRTSWASGDWLPTMAPSAIRDPAHHSVPYEMSSRDIRRVVQSFADAAYRCREGGLDGCELLATTHLLGQFISPLSNRRSDDYGGKLENRTRVLFEVIDAIRDLVGADFIVGVRFAADESNEGGFSPEEGIEIARLIGAHAGADFIDVNGTYGGTTHGLAENYPGMAFPAAPYVELARRVREASNLPVMQAARLNDAATANWAVENNYVDVAGLTRPLMADPHLVRKLQKGEEDRIRPCVGANFCIDRTYAGQEALCIHNVSTSRENQLPHEIVKAAERKKVVVIGGGPAGLEAARVAALRGHAVTLFEAGQQLGGQTLLAAKAGWRREIGAVGSWLASEIVKLGVEIHTSSYIEGPEILSETPDYVVVATGGVPSYDLPEGGDDIAVSTWDLLAGMVQPAADVLIYDESGGHAGLSVADWLAGQGSKVEMVTPDRAVGRSIGGMNYSIYLRNLYRKETVFTPDARLLGLRRKGNQVVATFENSYARERFERHIAQIVVEQNTVPADEPFQALIATSRNLGEVDLDALLSGRPQSEAANPSGTYMLFRTGDAVAARDIHAAILDSNRLCRTF